MNIILTGATSFLGRAVTEELIGGGHTVFAVVRPQSQHAEGLPVHDRFHRIDCDISSSETMTGSGLPRMDACIHLAWDGVGVRGRMDPDIQETNVRNTLKMMQTASELGCRRFLFAGSQAEYGVTAERVKSGMFSGAAVSEDTVCHPLSEYGKAKYRVLLDGSTLAEYLGMAYVHARIFSVYGPGDHGTSLVSACVGAAVRGEQTVLGPCTQLWNYLHVKDCARALSLLLSAPPAGGSGPDRSAAGAFAAGLSASGTEETEPERCVVNIGSERTRKLAEFVREIFETAGNPAGGCVFAGREPGPEGTPWLNPDCGKLKRLTGFREEITFADGIRDMIQNYGRT